MNTIAEEVKVIPNRIMEIASMSGFNIKQLSIVGRGNHTEGSEAEMQHAKSIFEGPKKQLIYEGKVPDEDIKDSHDLSRVPS